MDNTYKIDNIVKVSDDEVLVTTISPVFTANSNIVVSKVFSITKDQIQDLLKFANETTTALPNKDITNEQWIDALSEKEAKDLLKSEWVTSCDMCCYKSYKEKYGNCDGCSCHIGKSLWLEHKHRRDNNE